MALPEDTFHKNVLESRANAKKLFNCAGPHDFKIIERVANGQRYRCSKCEGELAGEKYYWYAKGFEHAKKKGG